jgi:translation initiation factor 2 alpha subunit (eIF-2alpha)
MVLRMPDGTYARATDEKQIDTACAIGATAFRINTQAPNTQAFVALLDRALDKPKEQAQDLNVNVSVDVADVLKQRFLKRKQGK